MNANTPRVGTVRREQEQRDYYEAITPIAELVNERVTIWCGDDWIDVRQLAAEHQAVQRVRELADEWARTEPYRVSGRAAAAAVRRALDGER